MYVGIEEDKKNKNFALNIIFIITGKKRKTKNFDRNNKKTNRKATFSADRGLRGTGELEERKKVLGRFFYLNARKVSMHVE